MIVNYIFGSMEYLLNPNYLNLLIDIFSLKETTAKDCIFPLSDIADIQGKSHVATII